MHREDWRQSDKIIDEIEKWNDKVGQRTAPCPM